VSDALVDRPQVLAEALLADRVLLLPDRQRQFLIAEAGPLQAPHVVHVQAVEPLGRRALAHRRDLDELPQEPRIDFVMS
jgi:hypothetical protein